MADTGRTVWADGLWADGFWATGLWASDSPPPDDEILAGAGYPVIYVKRKKKKQAKRLEEIVNDGFKRLFEEAIDSPVVYVSKALRKETKKFQKQESIDWSAVEKNAKALERIRSILEDYLQELDDEEVILLLMS